MFYCCVILKAFVCNLHFNNIFYRWQGSDCTHLSMTVVLLLLNLDSSCSKKTLDQTLPFRDQYKPIFSVSTVLPRDKSTRKLNWYKTDFLIHSLSASNITFNFDFLRFWRETNTICIRSFAGHFPRPHPPTVHISF